MHCKLTEEGTTAPRSPGTGVVNLLDFNDTSYDDVAVGLAIPYAKHLRLALDR